MIDKNTTKWKSAPFWVRFGLFGIRARKIAVGFEIISVILAISCLVLGFYNAYFFAGMLFFAGAYWYAICIRWVDNAGLW